MVLQSDVSLFLQLIQMKEIFLELRRLSLKCLILYESDLQIFQQTFKSNHLELTKLTSISFESAKFDSCSRLESGEINNFNLSFLFLAPNLRSLSFKSSNLLHVMPDEEVAAFCEKLKSVDLEYLNLVETCPSAPNCRKYSKILEAIGGGFRGDNHLRIKALDLSFNIFLGQTITQFVMPFVSELKICQRSCQSLLLQAMIP